MSEVSVVIDARDVSKSYGDTLALCGLNMTVEAGEVMGFLGPNGAGKSTMIGILMGLLRADGGSVSLLGRDPWTNAVELHSKVAYVPGDVTLWPTLSGGETIDLLGRIGPGIDDARRRELVERFQLDPTKKARTYSTGNRQKVALVAALASTAEVLVLDEPTSGLDPLMEAEFQTVVSERVADGATVLLSSHILAEAEALCSRITIIADGRTVESGSLADLRHLSRLAVTAVTASPPDGIVEVAGVSDATIDGNEVHFSIERDRLNDAIAVLTSHGLVDLTCQPPTLEALFMRHYESAPSVASDS